MGFAPSRAWQFEEDVKIGMQADRSVQDEVEKDYRNE
jgi:hypothetical protein